MICKVIDTINKYRLLDGVRSVAVGVSGGADSMCLLNILSLLKDEYGIILKAVHVNHNLRGDEALRDESLVRGYCAEKGIELTVYSADVKALSAELGIGTEECGRKVRYECFAKAGCDAVAVAHSLSDSVETTVYNLLRGTGIKGLCGIPVKREPDIIRPLIFCTREEIEAYCEKENIPYITDSTNLTDDYTRNYIRHNIIPSFERINGSSVSNISRASTVLREENDFIEKSATELIDKAKKKEGYDCTLLSSAHSAVRKRAILILLYEIMLKQPLYIHTDLVNSIVINNNGKVELSSGMYAQIKDGLLQFTQYEEKVMPWEVRFHNDIAETPYGSFRIISCDYDPVDKDLFDAEKTDGNFLLSSRREGDRFVFKSRKISKSLKKLFNEAKIPVAERDKKAVLRDGKNVIWVEGFGVSSSFSADENSKKIYKIKKDD